MELLAPAGGMESLVAAVRCGADAVYLGLRSLSARRGAQNFDEQELIQAVALCHERGVRVHLTLNTLLFDEETPQALRCIRAACQAGVDAVIVQDLGVLRLLRRHAPSLPLHASTQMALHNLEGVLEAARLGFSRVVLARELSLEEIERIARRSPVEVEVFCHGALCMSMSGRCLLSSMAGGRSGNRGLCAQPCRLPFSCPEAKGGAGHALSLRDLSLLTPEWMDALRAAGVASLKIEGRMKRPEYVAASVSAARAAMSGERPDLERLRAVFSRSGFTDGYLRGKLGREMFGVRTKEDVQAAPAVLGELAKLYAHETGRVPVGMTLTAAPGEKARLTVRDPDGREAAALGEVPQPARTRATTQEDAQRQLSRLGGTPYVLERLEAALAPGLMLPAGALNALRREAVERLSDMRAAPRPVPFLDGPPQEAPLPCRAHGSAPETRLLLQRAEQWTGELAQGCALAALFPAELCKLGERAAPFLDRLAVRQPPVSFDDRALERQLLQARDMGVTRLLVTGLDGARLGRRLGFELLGGSELNVTNTEALLEVEALGLRECTVSVEVSAARIRRLGGRIPRGIIGYGRLALMTFRNCPVRCEAGCRACGGAGVLIDRERRRFPVSCRGGTAQLYNSEVLDLGGRLGEIQGIDFIWLQCLDETPEQIARVLERYRRGEPPEAGERYTRGLYFRKVL